MNTNHQNYKSLRFALYARKSTESSDRQVQSIDDQVREMKAIADREKLDIVKTITEAKSAKQPGNRAGFLRLIELIESGEVDAILVWDISRLARNPEELGKLQQLLQDEKLKVIYTFNRIYLPEDNALVFSVEGSQANQFIRDLSKNTKRGLYSKLQKGQWPGLAPLGYKNNRLNKTIEVDEERFHLVRKMWEYLLTGAYNPSEIHLIATKEWGFTTPRIGNKPSQPVSVSTIYRILTNPFYAGILAYNGKEFQGNHEKVVTRQEFDDAQVILGDRGKPRKKCNDTPYTGLMRCVECGCAVTITIKHKLVKATGVVTGYEYLHCSRRKNAETRCTQPRSRLHDIESQLFEYLDMVDFPESLLSTALTLLEQQMMEEGEKDHVAIDSAKKRLAELGQKRKSLVEMRMQNVITNEEMMQYQKDLESERATLEEIISSTPDTYKRLELAKNTLVKQTKLRAKFVEVGIKERRIILKSLIETCVLDKGVVQLQFGNKILPFVKFSEELKEALEPHEDIVNIEKSEAFTSLIPILGG